MDHEAAGAQHPAGGKPHLRAAARAGGHLDAFCDHQHRQSVGVLGARAVHLAPEADLVLEVVDPENAVEVLAQLLAALEDARHLLEARDPHGVVGILIEQALDVLLEDHPDMGAKHVAELGRRNGFKHEGLSSKRAAPGSKLRTATLNPRKLHLANNIRLGRCHVTSSACHMKIQYRWSRYL